MCVQKREERETYILVLDERQRKDTYTPKHRSCSWELQSALDSAALSGFSLGCEQRGESMQCFLQPWRGDQESGLNLG